MSRSSYLKPDTVALHTGYVPESDHGSRAVPIYQTTSYVFESVSEGSSLFNVEQGGHIYSRITNPTVAVLEAAIIIGSPETSSAPAQVAARSDATRAQVVR